jgi:hypothetical protein
VGKLLCATDKSDEESNTEWSEANAIVGPQLIVYNILLKLLGPLNPRHGYKCADFRSKHYANYAIFPEITLANILHKNRVNYSAGSVKKR